MIEQSQRLGALARPILVFKLCFFFCCIVSLCSPVSAQETAEASQSATGVLTRAPEITKEVEAVYPPELYQAGTTGAVGLRITIDENGDVADVIVDQSSGFPALDASAVKALYQFGFKPAEVDGVPAAVQISYRYAFTIETEVVERPVNAQGEGLSVGRLQGRVLRRGSRDPIAGVEVRLPDLKRDVLTDKNGRFAFDELPAGELRIQLEDEGHYTLEDLEEIRAGEETEVQYSLEATGVDDRLIVVGRRLKKEVARRTITVREIRKIPGASGDALKVVENLPGTARVPFGGGLLVVRGSNPGDSAATIDRHFIPIPFHFFGLRSVIASETLESIDFYPGNFGAEFGRFSGGLIDVRLKRPRDDRWAGRVEADVFDAGIFVEGPLTENLTVSLGARRSYIDTLLPAVAGDDLDLTVAPRYYDLHFLLDYRIPRHRLRTFVLVSDDRLEFILNEPAKGAADIRGAFENAIGFERVYAQWVWQISDAVTNDLSAAFGRNSVKFNFGEVIRVNNAAYALNIREDLSWKISPNLTWRTGFDFEQFLGELDLNVPLPDKEGGADDRGKSINARDFLEAKYEFTLRNPAVWTELQWQLIDRRLLLVPGFRAEYDSLLDEYAYDPRLTVRYALIKEQTTLKGGVGLFTQRPSPDESDKTFGNPEIGNERAIHYSLGVEHAFNDVVELDLLGFYKDMYRLVRPVDDTSVDTALEDGAQRTLNNDGIGRVYGLELMLRHNATSRFFGWIAYTLMRAERKDPGENRYRLFDFDQTHIFTILGQYRISNRWEFGARWRYTTGLPQTPFVGSVYNSDGDNYEGIPGELNSVRMAPFHQLDLRLDRNWIYQSWTLTAYFEIRNAYNRANPEFLSPNYDFSETETVSGLPILPSIGLRGEF